jgi:ArsR family metal-binding transcriptional regulator
MKHITTFPQKQEFEKALLKIESLNLPHEAIRPQSQYQLVGVPAIVLDQESRAALSASVPCDFICSGWVDYYPPKISPNQNLPPVFDEDVFGYAAIMVLAPCIADITKIRLIAHISGDMTEVFPYLNAEMCSACYNANAPLVTFMDGYRMIVLYPRRIAVAKADDIIDGWRTLEMIRRMVNNIWARRSHIEPSYQMHKKPPALEIYKRLPGTNCQACGEKTCMLFALQLWQGRKAVSMCKPVFEGDFVHLKDALLEICAGLGAFEHAPGVN